MSHLFQIIIKRSTRLGQRGVTFVELLLVMGLLSVFLVVMTTIFTATLDIQTQSQAYDATLSDGRFIMARLNFDIARASAVTVPAAIGGSADNLSLSINATTYSYALSGDDLQLTDTTGSDNLNSNGTTVSALSFQRLSDGSSADTVHYSFTLTSKAHATAGHETHTFSGTAGLRP